MSRAICMNRNCRPTQVLRPVLKTTATVGMAQESLSLFYIIPVLLRLLLLLYRYICIPIIILVLYYYIITMSNAQQAQLISALVLFEFGPQGAFQAKEARCKATRARALICLS